MKKLSKELQQCYDAGWSAAQGGSDENNCNFRYFSTKEKMEAWSKGNNDFKKSLTP